MANDSRFSKVPRSTINFMFILIAAVLAFLSYMLKTGWEFRWQETNSWTSEAVKDIAIFVFSLALVDILWRRLGGDPLELHIDQLHSTLDAALVQLGKTNVLIQQSEDEGLSSIGSGYRSLAFPLLHLIAKSKNTIDMRGYTLHSVFQDGIALDALRDKIRMGAHMRILIVHPDNANVFDNIDPDNSAPMKGQIQAVCNWLDNMRQQLDPDQQKRLEVRLLKKEKLTISILRFDDLALVSIYLRSKYISETPSMIVEGVTKPLYKTFTREFQYFFAKGTSLW